MAVHGDQIADRREASWTLETLKAYFDCLVASNDRRYEQRSTDQALLHSTMLAANDARFHAAMGDLQRAVLKAEAASEKRFEGVNEFRNTLSDQQRTLMPRAESELRMNGIDGAIQAVKGELERASAAARADLERQIKTLTDAITALTNANLERRGAAEGGKAVWAYVVGVSGVLIAVITFLLRFMKPA